MSGSSKAKTCDVNCIKKEIERIFSPSVAFYNGEINFLEECRIIFSNPQVKKLLEDNEVVETINLFFMHNLNISLTSKAGYMHRNTLIYRLDKVNKLIGLDVKNFNDALLFVNFIMFYNNFKNELLK